MSIAGGWRLLQSSLVVILVISVLQIWVCCDCKAGAIRVFPGHTNVLSKMEAESSNTMQSKSNRSREALFHKYFGGSVRASNFNKTEQGYEDSKRRVPSCPDQLHNYVQREVEKFGFAVTSLYFVLSAIARISVSTTFQDPLFRFLAFAFGIRRSNII
ncbi:unnamed protein product [Prunus brigantina]